MPRKMQHIVLERGGFQFRLPSAWRRDHEDGVAVFHAPDTLTRSLRVESRVLDTPVAAGLALCEEMLAQLPESGGAEILRLATGNVLRHGARTVQEDGLLLHLFQWEIARPYPPRRVCLAMCAYTVLLPDAEDAAVRDTVAMLDQELRKAQFAPDAP